MKKIIKQPNEKYCFIDHRGQIEWFNKTEQEIIDLYIEKAQEDMKNAEQFTKIIECMEYGESIKDKRSISDEHLKNMGFNKPYKELVKYIPRKPLNQIYASCDFATYGKCPTCGATVQDGIGFKHEKCSCGQVLRWDN